MHHRWWSFSTHDWQFSVTPEEFKTVTNSDALCLVTIANVTVETNEEATEYITDLDIFLCVELVEDFSAVLSLSMLCETMSASCSWKTGNQPSLAKNGITRNVAPKNMSHGSQEPGPSECRRRLFVRLVTEG